MLENIELGSKLKHDFKVMSSKEGIFMKDLILNEAREILSSDYSVPTIEREENYTSLIINVSEDLKDEIKSYCNMNDIRLRDFWIECIHKSMRRYNGTGN